MARSRPHPASSQQQLSLDDWAESLETERAAEIPASDPTAIVHGVSTKASRRRNAAAVASAGSPAKAPSTSAAPKSGGAAKDGLSKHARRHEATRRDKAAETASAVDTATLLTMSEAARLLRIH